jgi:sulfite oxidase
LDELQRRFPVCEVTATVQCAGNRRAELQAIKPISSEVHWTLDAISTGVWRGLRLCDLLAEAGAQPSARHVLFDGLDTVEKEGRAFGFGGSIPLAKAWQEEVLLAYQLNAQPLPVEHGFPLRVVVPGYIGARSVKWLGHIRLDSEPSGNFFQTKAYKVFPPEVGPAEADWTQPEALAALVVNSVITRPQAGTVLPAEQPLVVEGYAIGGGNAPVETVEVSSDGGQTWQVVDMVGAPLENSPWAWRLWRATLQLPPGRHWLTVRATDAVGNRQPSDMASLWNFKGYMNNAWHRLGVELR